MNDESFADDELDDPTHRPEFLARLAVAFPAFAARVGDGIGVVLEHVEPPATDADLRRIEEKVRVPLPESFKALLRCARGFWLLGGVVQFGRQHPFVHDFEPFDQLIRFRKIKCS